MKLTEILPIEGWMQFEKEKRECPQRRLSARDRGLDRFSYCFEVLR